MGTENPATPDLGSVLGSYDTLFIRGRVVAQLVAGELAVDYCRYYENHHPEVVKGFFLKSLYKEWRVCHRAKARFGFGRLALIDTRAVVTDGHDPLNPTADREAELEAARATEAGEGRTP